MEQDSQRRRLRQWSSILLAISALVGAAAAWYSLGFDLNGPTAGVLACLAVVSELIPVELTRRGLRVTFLAPFIAAIAVTCGVVVALVVDVLIALAGEWASQRYRGIKFTPEQALSNALIAANSCVAGGVGMAVALSASAGRDAQAVLASAAFVLGYLAANVGMVLLLGGLSPKRPDRRPSVDGVGLARLLPLYTLLAAVATELALRGHVWALPLTFAPILALRAAVQAQSRLYEQYYETISSLAHMLQRAHPYTHAHLERVAEVAEEVARRLGMSPRHARMVREAAVLHDIGKIAVSEEVLDKPAKLDDQEMAHVRRHAAWGAQILAPVKQFEPIAPWIRHHHERPDGMGYPDRLSNVEIPIESKIIAVVDAFDAMTGGPGPGQQRTYRDPMSVADAMAELERCSGTQFDRKVVGVFRQVVREGYGR